MTFDDLQKATGSTVADAIKYCDHLEVAMARYGITSLRQRAAFIGGTVAIESLKLSKVEESLYYKDAQRTANIYKRVFHGNPALAEPYLRNSAALGELLYHGYWGRGLIQLTWEENYARYQKESGLPVLDNPNLLLVAEHAADVSGWFWNWKECNGPAEDGDMDTVTELINGPAKMHLAERKAGYELALGVAL